MFIYSLLFILYLIRELYEENIFNLIEETCIKLSKGNNNNDE